MNSILGFVLIPIFLASLASSYFTSSPYYKVTPGLMGLLSVFVLWIWMFVDFIKNRTMTNKMRWGISLVIFNWIAAIIYFFKIYYKNQDKIEFIEKIKLNKPSYYKYSSIVILTVAVTITHFFFFSGFYLLFGIPFFSLYQFVVEGIIYAPMRFFLQTIYSLVGVDAHSVGVPLFTRVVSFIYTSFLYFILIMTISYFKSRKNTAESSTIQ